MKSSKPCIVVLALGFALAASAWPSFAPAQETQGPEVAARVNGVAISRQTAERAEAIMLESAVQASTPPSEEGRRRSLRIALDRLINEELLYQEAQARGIKIDKEEVHKVIRNFKDSMPTSEFTQLALAHWAVKDEIVKTIERSLMIERLFKEEVLERAEVSEEDLRKFYQDEQQLFRTGPEVRLQQILLLAKPGTPADTVRLQAEEVAARAHSGEDFVALARLHSLGPAIEKGGDLGWRSVEFLPDGLRKAVEEAPVGRVVGPVPNPGGFVVAKVLEKRPSRVLGLEEVRDHISERLRESRLKRRQEEFLQGLRSRATVEVLLPEP